MSLRFLADSFRLERYTESHKVQHCIANQIGLAACCQNQDQSMFFWHMVRGAMEMGLEDFSYPTEVRLVHQARGQESQQ